jgi:hypothetical protein
MSKSGRLFVPTIWAIFWQVVVTHQVKVFQANAL